MPLPSPLVSVVVTCFNRERYLGEALDSLLAQTFTGHEIILVDDGSTDGSAAVAARHGDRLRYVHQENRGASAAKNAGVDLARGRYIAFLDSDDLWTPDKLSAQLAYARTHPEADLLYAHGRQFISPELPEAERARLCCPVEPMPAPTTGTLLVERATFRRVGPFRTDLKVGIDVEWHLRAKGLGLTIAVLPETLLLRRVHTTNSGLTEQGERRQHARILKEHLDRVRRGRAGQSGPAG